MRRDGENTERAGANPTPPAASAAVAAESGHAGSLPASGARPVGFVAPAAGPRTIALTNALEVVIEGYLLGDLESMATEIKPKEIGAVGYPMAMAVLAGSELLGALTSDVAKTNRIEHYWTTYMARVNEKYGDLAAIAAELFRNGIAHSYLSRPGVAVVRGGVEWHLQRHPSLGVVLDCVKLYRDFRRSYEDYAKRYILDNVTEAQGRLDKLTQHDHVKARRVEQLPPERWPPTGTATPPRLVGLTFATSAHLGSPS